MKRLQRVWVVVAPLADPGLAGKAKVCREHTTNRFIVEGEPEQIILSSYYQRKINNRELLVVASPVTAAKKRAK